MKGGYFIRVLMLLVLLVTTACSPEQSSSENDSSKTSSKASTLIENLRVPWEIVKSEDTIYISEREGTIVEYLDGATKRQSLTLKKPLLIQGEGGLLGLELAPDYSDTKLAYIYHTYESDGDPFNRVVEIKKSNEGWRETREVISGIPGSLYHNGGRVKFGSDGKLYVTTGDASKPDLAQNLNSLAGKILRINRDGTIPQDNPFDNSYIYSYGHRNPQGLAWNYDGELYSSEHGNSAHDEINKIIAGGNYGWPTIQGDQEKEGMIFPLYHSGKDTWAPSGIAIHEENLYVATLRGKEVLSFSLQRKETDVVLSDFGRMRSLLYEKGALYTITNNTDGRGQEGEKDDRFIKFPLQ